MYDFSALTFAITVKADRVEEICKILNGPRDGAPYGSSFAVTSEPGGNRRKIYLSNISFRTLDNIPGFFEKLQ
jgi:hypothetical protein